MFFLFIANTISVRRDITVIAIMNVTGQVIPLSLIWTDGTKYEIDRVLDIKKQASTKGGGLGLRYTVSIKGKQKYMWLDGNTWYIETTNNE